MVLNRLYARCLLFQGCCLMFAVLSIGSAGWWLLSAAAGAARVVLVHQLHITHTLTPQLQYSTSLLHCQQHTETLQPSQQHHSQHRCRKRNSISSSSSSSPLSHLS
jgi:hypothetical protein